MDNKQTAFFILVFWLTFSIVLVLLGYGTPTPAIAKNSMYGDFTTDSMFSGANALDNLFNPAINPDSVLLRSTNTGNTALDSIAGALVSIVNFITSIIVNLINLVIFILKFLYLIILTLTLTFGGINFYLARFINIIQLISLIFASFFIRSGKS